LLHSKVERSSLFIMASGASLPVLNGAQLVSKVVRLSETHGRRLHGAVFSPSAAPRLRSLCRPSTSTAAPPQPVAPPPTTTHFGYETVATLEKAARVRSVFSSVAESYDVMNDLLSGGLHRLWKDELVRRSGVASANLLVAVDVPAGGAPPLDVLDVAGGTGDVAFRHFDAAGLAGNIHGGPTNRPVCAAVTVCDINPQMLQVGEARAAERGATAIRFVEGDAERLPFADEEFDVYTIAFGLRNVTDVDAALRDAHRVLRTGGHYLCLEFSRVPNDVLRNAYDAYSFNVIPKMGAAVAGDEASYRYLVESIRKFSDQSQLITKMENAGFVGCSYTNLAGGIVAIHEGWKI